MHQSSEMKKFTPSNGIIGVFSIGMRKPCNKAFAHPHPPFVESIFFACLLKDDGLEPWFSQDPFNITVPNLVRYQHFTHGPRKVDHE